MKGFDCRDQSLWIPKCSEVSGYKARSIHLQWLDFGVEGAIGGNPPTQQMPQLFQDFSCLAILLQLKRERVIKTPQVPRILLHRAVAEACWGFCVSFFFSPRSIWNVIFHICFPPPQPKFPATVTKGIVLFHVGDCPPIKVSRLKYLD